MHTSIEHVLECQQLLSVITMVSDVEITVLNVSFDSSSAISIFLGS